MDPEQIIELLNLIPLPPEGGYYRETYRSPTSMRDSVGSEKSICTAIYYLLTPDTFSGLHKLPADEIYHFYIGDPVRMLLLHPDGKGEEVTLGQDIENGEYPQFIVPAGVWQGSHLIDGGKLALMGTTMSPGFDFSDYEPGIRDELLKVYTDHSEAISKLCKE